MAAFLAILFIYSEFNTTIAGESAMVLFKRGTKAPILDQDKKDEEESSGRSSRDTIEDASAAAAEAEKAMAEHPPMTDLFSWQHLQYTVPVAEGQRRLLSDVSGYVAPGKLTALMGESGAGKVGNDVVFHRNKGLIVCADYVAQRLGSTSQQRRRSWRPFR